MSKLKLLMNGISVGTLTKDNAGGLHFKYDSSWLSRPAARPISLSLPLSGDSFMGDRVYNFFENLLPDNPELRARIQAKFQTKTSQAFDLLSKIGKDCVGAIQIIEDDVKFQKKIDAIPLSDKEIADILKNYRQAPLGMVNNDSDFRISIAGAQEKSAFLFHNDRWCRPVGTTPTTHIFKLPIGVIEHQQMDLSMSCENEWLCTKIAASFKLPVARAEVITFEDVKVLVVERFDRNLSEDKSWIMRLPQEDLCQALGYSPNLKYQSDGGPGISDIMNLLLKSEHPERDRDTFFRSQILFWLLAAIDGHAKNFSIYINKVGTFSLTPLYDIMSAYPLINNKQLQLQKVKMAMALRGKNNHYHIHNIQHRHFIQTAKAVNYSISKAESALNEMLAEVENVITKVRAELPKDFPTHISDSIFDGMQMMQRRLRCVK